MHLFGTALSALILKAVYVSVIGGIVFVIRPIRKWFYANTTAQERADLRTLAEAAVPFVEHEFPQLAGALQFQTAVDHVMHWAGIEPTAATGQEITAVKAEVQRAWSAAKVAGLIDVSKPKGATTGATTTKAASTGAGGDATGATSATSNT